MPFINVRTNTAVSDTAEQAMKRQLGQAIEALPGKSEAWLMVNFEPEARLWFAGSDDAAAMVEVSAYGSVADDAADSLTARHPGRCAGHCRKPHLRQICRDTAVGLERGQFLKSCTDC